ncbi:MAG: septum formation initiator family protein [Acidobacteriota bacterium]|nr:septum formation initiator family protein [Acidobacteriota bacterium]
MSKVVATYWDNSQTVWITPQTVLIPRNTRAKTLRDTERAAPQWLVFAVIASLTCMLCLTINFRAFSEMSQEMSQNQTLTSQMEILTTENLSLQEEIHSLKSDPRTIEREARKIGMSRPNEKILVSSN